MSQPAKKKNKEPSVITMSGAKMFFFFTLLVREHSQHIFIQSFVLNQSKKSTILKFVYYDSPNKLACEQALFHTPPSLGHFTVGQYLLGPFSPGPKSPAKACEQATNQHIRHSCSFLSTPTLYHRVRSGEDDLSPSAKFL